MEARFINGVTVNRFHGDASDGELVGAFQYIQDAEIFVQARMARDVRDKLTGSHYMVACTCSGRVRAFHHPAATKPQVV